MEAGLISSRPELGLVCITASERVRYRALTRKRLLALPADEQQRVLLQLYEDNLQSLNAALTFCHEQQLRLYRLTSGLFPFADEPPGAELLARIANDIRLTGERAIALDIRLVVHPDQFVVLSSDSPTVIENSIKILNMHGRILDLLGLPRSAWACIELHGGKGDRSARLIQVINELPEAIRSRLVLENDERAYSATEILAVCRTAHIPMVFDAHHHLVHEQLDSYDHPSVAEMLEAARSTWTIPEWQLVHISNGRTRLCDAHHSDFIELMPASFRRPLWIEVEAKQKELAIEKLRREWLPLE